MAAIGVLSSCAASDVNCRSLGCQLITVLALWHGLIKFITFKNIYTHLTTQFNLIEVSSLCAEVLRFNIVSWILREQSQQACFCCICKYHLRLQFNMRGRRFRVRIWSEDGDSRPPEHFLPRLVLLANYCCHNVTLLSSLACIWTDALSKGCTDYQFLLIF